MPFMVDPNQLSESGSTDFEKEQYALEGKKVLQCVGTYKSTSSNGTQFYRCKFVVLNDLEDQGDEGNVVWKNFFLSDKAIKFLIYFTNSVGHRSPFDAEQEAIFDQIAKSRPFLGTLVAGGDYGPEINRFNPVAMSQIPSGMDAIVKTSTDKFNNWVEWKRSSKDTYTRGSSSVQNNNGGSRYDDIPF
jgi:hypothetical protein